VSDPAQRAFARTVRDLLRTGQDVAVPGIGEFRLYHRSARLETKPDGHRVMTPPQDAVLFEPDDALAQRVRRPASG
jgi:nucleoid DNA-binding protein